MKKRIYFSLLLFLVCVHVAWAQGQIRGRILDKKSNTPLEFINVAIRKQGDTKIFKGAISDTEGSFLITGLPDGQYTLTTSFTGYKDVVRAFSDFPSRMPTITIQPSTWQRMHRPSTR